MDIIDEDGNPVSSLVPHRANELSEPSAPLPWGVRREVTRQVARTFGRYTVERVKVEGAAALTELAMRRLDDLQDMETRSTVRDPMNSGARHRRLVEEFVNVAADSIRRVGGRR